MCKAHCSGSYILTYSGITAEGIEISELSKVTGQEELGFCPGAVWLQKFGQNPPPYTLTPLDIITPKHTETRAKPLKHTHIVTHVVICWQTEIQINSTKSHSF